MSGAELATRLEQWCGASRVQCETTFHCGNFIQCDPLYTDQEASIALHDICNTGDCAHSFRIAVRDDNIVLNLLAEGMFEGGPSLPGARGRVGVHGKTAHRAQLSACKAGGNSFIPGTLVLLADGSSKPIEEIRVGDTVLATDPETGRTAARVVTDLIVGDGSKGLVEITVVSKGAAEAAAKFVATDGHPFWVQSLGKWIEAEDLRHGDVLRTPAGAYAQVTALRSWAQPQRVHNLTIADLHTYYVVAGGVPVLVHNDGGADWVHVNGPNGEALPLYRINDPGRPLTRGFGRVYQIPEGTKGLDKRVAQVRVMAPSPRNPHGYVVYMNEKSQTVNPLTGRTPAGKSDPYAHLKFDVGC